MKKYIYGDVLLYAREHTIKEVQEFFGFPSYQSTKRYMLMHDIKHLAESRTGDNNANYKQRKEGKCMTYEEICEARAEEKNEARQVEEHFRKLNMTLEEKAEQYVIKNVCENCNHCQSKGYMGCDTYRFAKKTYIDSAEENGVVWHDLRKDPNDLPEANWKNWVIAVYDGGTLWGRARREVFADGVYWVNSLHYPIYNVVLWAKIEIPQFKE